MSALWTLTLWAAPALAPLLEEALGEEAVAVTSLPPNKAGETPLEFLFQEPPERAALPARLAFLAGLQGAPTPRFELKEGEDLNWLQAVARELPHHRLARWTVFGENHRPAEGRGLLGLEINATSAFGTGDHPTTHGCLVAMDALLKKTHGHGAMLDMGTGSGILAMAYLKAAPRATALAIDIERDAARIAQERARKNGLTPRLTVRCGHGYHAAEVRRRAPYALIAANIFSGPLRAMAKDLARNLAPGGHVILAGFLHADAPAVLAAHRAQGLSLVRRFKRGEWTILWLRQKDG